MNRQRLVVFSDLDGALLDDKTFEWTGARAVLRNLKQAGIPLVFVSSKTREEISTLRAQLGNQDPFAAENGAVVVRPHRGDRVLGLPREELEPAAEQIAQETGCEIELLAHMTRRRAMQVTGLPDSKIGPACRRSYSAPFLLREGDAKMIHEAARRRRLRVIPGRRLLQLVGDHDKGEAVRMIAADYPGATTIGIGDGPNDIPLLRAVDRPIFQGRRPPASLPPNTHFEPMTGPNGWSRAVWKTIGPTPRMVGGAQT